MSFLSSTTGTPNNGTKLPQQPLNNNRQISLVDRLELSFPTSKLNPNALILGDIDNDPTADIEIAVGNGEGELFIYKGRRKQPWRRASGLGSISCLALGDLKNQGKNSLVVLSTEGHCYLFDVPFLEPTSEKKRSRGKHSILNSSGVSAESLDSVVDQEKGSSNLHEVPSTNNVQSNSPDKHGDPMFSYDSISTQDTLDKSSSTKWLHPASGPPSVGLDPALTPKVEAGPVSLHTPKPVVHDDWVSNAPSSSQSSLQLSNLADQNQKSDPSQLNQTFANKGNDRLFPLHTWFISGNANCAIIADIDEDHKKELVVGSNNRVVFSYSITDDIDPATGNQVQVLKLKNKWNVPGQVASLSISHDSWGRPILVVAQHGGNYTTIDHRGTTKYRQFGIAQPISHINSSQQSHTGPAEIRHAVRSHLSPSGAPQDPILMAMIGLDGTIKLQEESSKLLWERNLEHQLFCLCVADITGDGNQEIVASSWDGKTFIFDQHANCVEIQFEERVRAFTAGSYSLTQGNSQPCLIFITFTDQMFIYYNLGIKTIPVSTLIGMMQDDFERCKNIKQEKNTEWSRVEQIRLVRSLLEEKFDEKAAENYKKLLEKRLKDVS